MLFTHLYKINKTIKTLLMIFYCYITFILYTTSTYRKCYDAYEFNCNILVCIILIKSKIPTTTKRLLCFIVVKVALGKNKNYIIFPAYCLSSFKLIFLVITMKINQSECWRLYIKYQFRQSFTNFSHITNVDFLLKYYM